MKAVRPAVRVCHFSTVHQPFDVRIFVRECGSLAKAGYEVHLVIGAPKDELKDGIHVHKIPRFSSRILRMTIAPWLALRKILKIRAEIYHYHDPELIWLGFLLRWVFGKRVVFDIHESVYRQLQSKKYLPGPLGILAGASFMLVERLLTVGQQKVVANEASVGEHRNPVLVQNFPRQYEVEASLDRFSPNHVPLIVYVGSLTEIRGAMEYLQLAKMLKANRRKFRMAVIGRIGTKTLENRMRARIEADGLGEEVSLLGRQPWEQAMQTVADASIGLCLLHPVPNYTTCLATKIIEYMMLGTPVLASDFDCWRRYVEGEQVGRMVDPLDVDSVYRVCTEMLDDLASLKAMSQRGPAAVAARYTWDREFENLLSLYEQMLGSD